MALRAKDTQEPLRVLALPLYGPLAASTRHRVSYYLPGLEARGIRVDLAPFLDDDYLKRRFARGEVSLTAVIRGYARRARQLLGQRRYDVAWVQGELSPLLPGWLDRLLLRLPYVYDFDDAFYLKYALRGGLTGRLLGAKFEQFIGGAAVTVAGNATLAAHATQYCDDVRIVPTVVDHDRYLPADLDREGGVFNVGWIGSPSSIRCLKVVEAPLQALATEGAVRLTVVGGVASPIPGVEVVNVPWSEASEVSHIRQFDVGIMPLEDEPWTRGKCGFKLIQYMACGVPAIGSPVGANRELLSDGVGVLAADCAQWLKALRQVRDDPAAARKMGDGGRARVRDGYSLASQLDGYAQLLSDAAGRRK
jgi:glycosyltransferase involved in cell wall biosynthesis